MSYIMAVTIDGAKSDSFLLDYGVPQGSVLSPTVFLIFINDSLTLTFNNLISFTDDCTLLVSFGFEKYPTSRPRSNSQREMISFLETDLAPIHSWEMKSLVEFNPKKTQFTLYSLTQWSPNYDPPTVLKFA